MNNNNPIKTSKIRGAIGFAFILFGIVCLIDIGYISQSIVMALAFFFGLVSYWFIYPLLIGLGIYLLINRKKPFKLTLNATSVGIGLLIFALLILFTIVPYGSGDNSIHITNFNNLFIDSYLNAIPKFPATNYQRLDPLYASLGGGWFGHLFAGLLSLITYAGAIIIASLILVIAVILITHTYIADFFAYINKRRKAKATNVIDGQAVQNISNEAINEAPVKEIKHPTFNNVPLPDEDVGGPSVLEKANLYSNNDAPEVTDINEQVQPMGSLKSANLLGDDANAINDIPNLDKKEEKILPPYQLPSLDLLKDYDAGDIIAKNEESCKQNEEIINATFAALRIGAKVVGHTIGPRVTRYDVKIEASASIQAIPRYVSDISQRLGGVQARFEPIVAGKVTSGLEVP
ncbi:MAG: hypothetical protein MJ208_04350, partial [Bacilli bacterium]|nr:hypothetical protein [Bacilli bacterium]